MSTGLFNERGEMKPILWFFMLISLCVGCQKMENKPGTTFVDATVSLGDQDPIPLSVTNLTYDHLQQRYYSAFDDNIKNIHIYAPDYPFTGTADDAFSGQQLPGRAKGTYFFDFTFSSSGEDIYGLYGEEIHILRKMASGGDRIAGARLYLYYTRSNSIPELAEEVLDLAPVGNGINQYFILDFIFKLPDGTLMGSAKASIIERFYLQKKQVLELTSLSAMGGRPAAARLSEYFLWGVNNEDLAMLFWKFARGDDSALPEIKELDARFKRGDQELIRKSFSTPLEKMLSF